MQLLAAAVGAGLARQHQEAEAARSRVQFEQFFSSALANQLQADPTLLDGRDWEITVLFSDIRGFSGLSERLSPERNVPAGGGCDGTADRAHRRSWRRRGRLHRRWPLGDVERAGHSNRSRRAGLPGGASDDRELPSLNEDWQQTLGAPLGLGLGINTGVARSAISAAGDASNTARWGIP